MKIHDNIYNFSFQFIDYEFDTFTNESDIYDLNWLKCRYEFIFKGKHLSIDDASMTTFDVLNFISEIEYILVNNEYKQIELQNLEPDFLMTLISSNRGYTLNIHYNFYLSESFESIDFSVEMTKEEVVNLVEELKLEISKFPYRRVVNYFEINSKYESMNDLAIILKNDQLINGTITNNATDIIINKNEFFKIEISDIYCQINNKYLYSISLNNKPYSYVEEDNLINEVHKLYDNNKLIIEYIYEVGFLKRRWFDNTEKSKIKLNKINRKILRIFNSSELLYYNKNNITLHKDLIEKNKLTDIDNRMVKIYFSSDYTRRIQIYKTNNVFSYIFEELEFREEIEYGTTYNYAYWSKIDDGQSHSYCTIDELEKDISYIIEENGMFKK
ncbi:MAG: hypothetical protein IKT40_05180 [Bacilli bacterium]|nr:hypothetical protein [Bacilli bacterium]